MDEDMSPRFFASAPLNDRVGVGGGKLVLGCGVRTHGRRGLFRRER